jgi:hypothetical protein
MVNSNRFGGHIFESMGANRKFVAINFLFSEFLSFHLHDLQKCCFLVVQKFTVPNMKYEWLIVITISSNKKVLWKYGENVRCYIFTKSLERQKTCPNTKHLDHTRTRVLWIGKTCVRKKWHFSNVYNLKSIQRNQKEFGERKEYLSSFQSNQRQYI